MKVVMHRQAGKPLSVGSSPKNSIGGINMIQQRKLMYYFNLDGELIVDIAIVILNMIIIVIYLLILKILQLYHLKRYQKKERN
jgi:membrane protein YdbS with pleckstrin-like domain